MFYYRHKLLENLPEEEWLITTLYSHIFFLKNSNSFRSISSLKVNKNSKQRSWRTIISLSNLDMAEYKAKLITVQKCENNLKIKLSKDLEGDFVTKVKYMLWTKHVDSIKHHKTFIQI